MLLLLLQNLQGNATAPPDLVLSTAVFPSGGSSGGPDTQIGLSDWIKKFAPPGQPVALAATVPTRISKARRQKQEEQIRLLCTIDQLVSIHPI